MTSRQRGTINSKQLNSLRQTVNKIIKKRGRIVIKVFPQFSLTKKSVASRMGKGKGNPSSWVSKIIKGTPICEIEIDEKAMGLKALKLALVKLSIRTKTITN